MDWKNGVIAILVVLVVALGALLAREKLPKRPPPVEKVGVPVKVLDVVLDREGMQAIDVLFDAPLGEKVVGEILGHDPATIMPQTGGSWRWMGPSVLRFEATNRFEMATDYRIDLRTDRLLRPGQYLQGKSDLRVRTDQFRVEGIDVYEEPATEGEHRVILRGDLRFNYPVDPKSVATKVKLIDPLLGPDKPVAVTIDVPYWSETIGFRTDPVDKGKEERTLRLVVLSDLTSVSGNVPLTKDFEKPIVLSSRDTLTVRGTSSQPGEPDSIIKIRFSSPVSAAIAPQYVSVTPAVKYRVSTERDELILAGAFEPGSKYRIAVTTGLPARDGSVLREKVEQEVAIADREPAVEFESDGMFLARTGYRTIALESVNVPEIQVTVDRVYRNNVFFLFENFGYSAWNETFYNDTVARSLGDRIATDKIAVPSEKNRTAKTAVVLDRYLKDSEPGLYRIGVSRTTGDWGKQRWLLITDLGIVAKRAEDELLVWASSFANLGPIANADVTLVSDQNQTLATGKTDAAGMWRITGLAKLLETGGAKNPREPYMVTVASGGDFSFLILERSQIDTAGLDVGGATPTKQG
ncbi:MAG: alpha-2-macroglobulin, partial [Candidatus Binatota bacterium]|nr:alpha-2-macroglobulin [Candidatus Binatota bacterium]